jgi:hypothetical protein
MRESIHFAPNERKSAKQQALGVVKALQASDALPIMRALMQLRVVVPVDRLEEAKAKLRGLEGAEERMQLGGLEPHEQHDSSLDATTPTPSGAHEEHDSKLEAPIPAFPDTPFLALECRADPSLYRPIAELVATLGGSLHMLAHKASGAAAENKASGAAGENKASSAAAESGESGGRVASGAAIGAQAPAAVSHGTVGAGTAAARAAVPSERGAGGRGGNTGGGRGGGRDGGRGGAGGGKGGKEDEPAAAARRAERLFKINLRSADNGDPIAQLEVGKAYLGGVGVEKDAAQARHWLEQALRQGVQAAKAHLEQLPGV